MGFFSFGNNDAKEDQAVVAQLQVLTTAVTGLQATVTGLRNNISVLIGRINQLMAIDNDIQNEVAAEAVDIGKMLAAQNQLITDEKLWLSAQPSIPADVQARLVNVLSSLQAGHQQIIDATATVQAADPGPAPVPVINP